MKGVVEESNIRCFGAFGMYGANDGQGSGIVERGKVGEGLELGVSVAVDPGGPVEGAAVHNAMAGELYVVCGTQLGKTRVGG